MVLKLPKFWEIGIIMDVDTRIPRFYYTVDSRYLDFAANNRLSRNKNLVLVLTWNLTTGNKVLWKIAISPLFYNIFNISNFRT